MLDENPISFNNIYGVNNSLEIPLYFIESKERFLKRDFISSDYLTNKPVEEVLMLLDGKVLMMVDPNFADGDNYYVVRVFRYAGEE